MKIYRPIGGFKYPVTSALAASILTLLFYLVVVAITTPNFPPLVSMQIAFGINGPIFVAFSIGMGIQAFLVVYSRRLPCPIGFYEKKAAVAATGLSSALSAFFSFFSLVVVGCCGLWLYILSLLPALLGVGLSGLLIAYSNLLSVLGLIGVAISIFLMIRNVRSKLRLLQPPSEK
ncbi:MAG: hypothetical protein GTN80_07270 [Nitrososphaeria archaeon]|nr:hypothetical protein [Nitrososphaeria archaeon]NIQ33425.1 hypothetical protein [Nitrososphaeria archaeon]